MKKAGIILLILQAVSLIPAIITGDLAGHTLSWYVGRFSFGIVGIILLIIHSARNQRG